MPRQNQFFDNLSDTPIMSKSEAVEVLKEYCGEHDIGIYTLPNATIDNFIEVLRYAPYEIETEEIARRVGVVVQRSDTSYFRSTNDYYYAVSPSEVREVREQPQTEPRRVVQAVPSAVGGTRRVDFAEVLRQAHADIMGEPCPTLDEVLELSPEYSYIPFRTSNKKKKRTRSEKDMMAEIVRSEKFPRPNFKDWSSSRELGDIVDNWYGNVDYREQWIFSRREREGFNRRNIGFFSLDDVMARMSKRRKPHALDTDTNKFYDWKLGGTDWILRLELYQHEQYYFLITRHIHKPTNSEIKFDVRYWSNDRFKFVNCVWNQEKNNDIQFDRIFGNSNEDSPYYIAPYEYDEDEIDEDYEEDCDCEEIESGDW